MGKHEGQERKDIGGQMDYDYEAILSRYRVNYAQLAEEATPGSIERRTYEYIVKLIDRESAEPPEEKAFQLIMLIMMFAKGSSQPEARAIYRQCGLDLNRDTGQEPWRF